MKWDVDKELKRYEPNRMNGTILQRVVLDRQTALREGLKIPEADAFGGVYVWCLAVGCVHQAKHFVYGMTIRECLLRIRKQVKLGLEFNPQLFPQLYKKPKRKEKVRKKPVPPQGKKRK